MDDSHREDELANAVIRLADAGEQIASGLGYFDATDDAQVARQTAQRTRNAEPVGHR